MSFQAMFANVLTITAWTTVFTSIAVTVAAILEGKPAYAPMHSISHILFGEKVLLATKPDPTYIAVGFFTNLSAMVGWAIVAEIGFQVLKLSSKDIALSCLLAVAVTVLAYFVDYHLVPKRFTPGIEDVLSKSAIYAVYVFLAIGFAIGGLQRI